MWTIICNLTYDGFVKSVKFKIHQCLYKCVGAGSQINPAEKLILDMQRAVTQRFSWAPQGGLPLASLLPLSVFPTTINPFLFQITCQRGHTHMHTATRVHNNTQCPAGDRWSLNLDTITWVSSEGVLIESVARVTVCHASCPYRAQWKTFISCVSFTSRDTPSTLCDVILSLHPLLAFSFCCHRMHIDWVWKKLDTWSCKAKASDQSCASPGVLLNVE